MSATESKTGQGTPPSGVRGRSPRSRWGRGLLAGVVAVWALLVVAACAVVLSPTLPGSAWLASLFTTSFSLYLAVPAIVGVVLAVVAWRQRWRAITGGVAVVTVLALAGAVVPWATAARTAAANHVDLSLSAYFRSGPTTGAPTATETFATVDGHPLRLDVRRTARPAPGAPALVFVHGGSWVEGGRNQLPGQLKWFADQGYTVFDIEYRLSPPPRWHQQASDVKCAIGWVAQNAARYAINPGNITVAGASAGGNLALLAAYTTGTGTFPPSCPVPERRVRAVISFYGPTDTTRAIADSGSPGLADPLQSKVFGGTPKTAPEAYRVTSPITYVRPGLPPTLQLHGSSDHVASDKMPALLDHKLAAASVPHRTVLLPYAEHGYNLFQGSWPSQISNGVLRQFLTTHTR